MKNHHRATWFASSSLVFNSTVFRSLLISFLFFIGANFAFAASGDLDPSFGSGGKVITPFGSSTDNANAVAIQSDGKIVAAGSSSNGSNLDFAVARYSTDGSLDTSFGSGGKVTTAIGSSTDNGTAVAIQPDGKIIVAGSTFITGSGNDFALVRYNTDGTLDPSFGSGGKVITAISSGNDSVTAVVIQSDGRIVAA